MTLSEVIDVKGSEGDFSVTVRESPRYVDMDKCIACGECATKCPKKVTSEYNAGTGQRKAIYVKYSQAVPLKYQIDPDKCIYLNKPGKCGACAKVCPAGAINFQDTEKIHQIQVGAIIMAPGFQTFDPAKAGIWGYGKLPNVITSMQLERYCSATGPTEGHLIRPSDGKPARKIAFLQCVGSRDENKCGNGYCSSVCCMYAIKEAIIAQDHAPGLQTSIFFMDMRTHGKDFDRYYAKAKQDYGVRFVRCRVHGVEPVNAEGDLRLHYINEEGRQIEEYYDMVVLSVGLETPKPVVDLANKLGIAMTSGNFAATSNFLPVLTSRPGIFTCGAFAGPKDIPQSVMEGSAAAAGASRLLSDSRGSLTREKEFPRERDVAGEPPAVGVFVCHCGSNIAGVVDVEDVAKYAETLPGVVYVERNLFSCSQDTQDMMAKRIREKGLNRIVVAACTPRTHETLFRETLKTAGINEYLFEMANIRNQNSWVHSKEPAKATQKAKDLIRMAVAKVLPQVPLYQLAVDVRQSALVIGGGLAGMTAALNLADQGFPVHLVEKTDQLCGFARRLNHTTGGEDIPRKLVELTSRVTTHDHITLHLKSEVSAVEGFIGNFTSTVRHSSGDTVTVEHGAGIIATGGLRYQPHGEYGYGQFRGVYSGIEFDVARQVGDKNTRGAKTVVFIQCVGSRQQDRMYCSKVCCTHSIKTAIDLKREDSGRRIYILYRDIRSYGEREALYKQAREMGVIFINYEAHGKPEVSLDADKGLNVRVIDHVLHRPLSIQADAVVLAEAILANPDAKKLGTLFKLPVDGDGFFQEAHAKLRPVDFATEGMFVAGLAHYPKPVEESIAQAMAAASRAATVLAKKSISLEAIKATVSDEHCDGCALCLDVCPFNAITLSETRREDGSLAKRIVINMAKCKGCGLCQGTCPKRGVSVAGFTLEQMRAQVAAALAV
ncbi:MAG: heterodisulfide reductase [Desulfobulbaceae bacterium A2]|nr:MAG: heterodisulfide reductase [Desulfobulbaceae bacterium A2]